MQRYARTFRVFVSSTFNDLKTERNALQAKVFPRLRTLCQQHGARFQPIDLRWGVSDEASLDQQAMNICLGEIDRCQQMSPRPNFLILLGDRYGWCPPPSSIKVDVFEKIMNSLQKEADRQFLRDWYQLDQNAVPPVCKLKPRLKGTEFEKPSTWQPVETGLHDILARASGEIGLSEKEKLPFVASATEQEIFYGALGIPDSPEHVLCFLRNVKELPQQFNEVALNALVDERVCTVFPAGLDPSCLQLARMMREKGSFDSASKLAVQIKQKMDDVPKASLEAEYLALLNQALIDHTAKDYINLDENDWSVDHQLLDRQVALKKQLNDLLKQNVYSYTARWTGSGITSDHIDQLCEDVYHSLEKVILSEIENPHKIHTIKEVAPQIQPDKNLDIDGLSHQQFAEERMKFFVGRSQILSSISHYVTNSQHKILLIVGEGGTGKSALMAKAIHQTQVTEVRKEIIYRFIGATPSSSDGRGLLESLCHEITRRYSGNPSSIPMDYRELVPEFSKKLQLATAEKPLLLFLDSLDQLSISQGARGLTWLPNELPDFVSVIVSTRGGEMDTYRNMKGKNIIEAQLGGLSPDEGRELLDKWLLNIGRTLQSIQKQAVLEKFSQSQNNPLYLKLAFEEAKLWTSYDTPVEALAIGVSGIIEKNMLDRLKNESNHGDKLVLHTLGYLAASRNGLTEDEVVDLLSRDLQVYEWFFKKSHHLPSDLIQSAVNYRRKYGFSTANGDAPASHEEERAAQAWLKEIRNPPEKVSEFLVEALKLADGPRLPIVLWSRLSFDLEPYLTERMVDGNPLLYFYHRELGEVATSVCLSNKMDLAFHERLANYFHIKADPQRDKSWTGKAIHALSELPYHLTSAGMMDEVYQVLTDFKFLEHKADEVGVLERRTENGEIQKTATGVLQLQEDYEHVLQLLGGTERSTAGLKAPLIITARETDGKLTVYCPVCNTNSPVIRGDLGMEIPCPQEGCKAPLKINPFIIGIRS